MAWRAGLHGTAVTPMSQWVTSEDLTGNGTDGPGYWYQVLMHEALTSMTRTKGVRLYKHVRAWASSVVSTPTDLY
jgi:hypothetical protein